MTTKQTVEKTAPGAAGENKSSPAIGSEQELSGIGPVGNEALVEA